MIGQQSPLKVPVGAGRRGQRWRVAAVCLVLAAITFAVFGQTLTHEFINFDDNDYVYENPVVAGGLSLKNLAWVFTHVDCDFYHPLTMLSLMGDYQFYGLHAGGYHFTNVLLHTASAILLFLVLRQMTGALWRSAFVAAVFAIHPLRVESVAWVTERKDMLSGLFFVLTLGAYVRYTRAPFSLVRYLTVMLLFALGLLSKPSLVTLPFVLLLLDYWPLCRMQPAAPRSTFQVLRALLIEKIPLFVLSAGACVVTLLTQQPLLASVGEVPLLSRMGYAAISYVVYLGQMFYPAGLAVMYPFPPKGPPLGEVVLALALLAGISAGAFALRERHPYLLVGWLWYLGMLMPMIGLVHAGCAARADRFTYLAQIGVYMMMALAARDATISRRYGRRILGVGALSVIMILMVCAWKQTGYWKDSEILWTHTLACTTANAVAHNNLGATLHEKGEMDEAISHFQKALQINPDHAQAHNNLGNALREKGNVDEAITHYQKALKIIPDDASVHFNFGNALREKGNVDEAITQYQKALQIKPDYMEAQVKLGNVLLQKGKADEAVAHFQRALEINPNNAGIHLNLGLCFSRLGRMDQAISQYQKALQIEPADTATQNNLAWLLATGPEASLRNGDKAVELATQANTLTGGENPVILHTLAAAYAEAGRFGDAVQSAQKAIELARAAGQQEMAAHLEDELKRYEAGLPLRQ
jgi:tetratricopeptide (TPR) repeat protein